MTVPQHKVAGLVQPLEHAPERHATRGRSTRAFGLIAEFSLVIAIPGALVGFGMHDALALAVSAVFMGVAFMSLDLARLGRGGITPITLYAFTWTLASIANVIAVINQDTAKRGLYYIYAIDEHLPLALKISWLGLVVPVLSFWWATRSPTWRSIGALLPRITGTIPRQRMLLIGVVAAAIGIAANITGALPSLGTLTSVLFIFPHLAAFTLARAGVALKWRAAVWTALGIAAAETLRALMTAYLRSDIISPVFAYGTGLLIGAGSLRALRSMYMVPVYALAIPFVVYFAAFAEVRGRSSGVERLWEVAETQAMQAEIEQPTRHNLVARLSTINQLTQVGRIVDEDGFLNGQTLEYLAYAWIPRFLWPEKPTIAKGAWFALRIGQARIVNGNITNSVNMTIPGELYLNFSWIGVFIGGGLFGILLGVLWSTTGSLANHTNVLGAAFAFYLLWIGLGGGVDLQIVVTLVAMYGIFLFASIAFPRLSRANQSKVLPNRRPARPVST